MSDYISTSEAAKNNIGIHDIPGYETFEKIKPITKGWSEDKKYCVTKSNGTKYLLRVSPIERYEMRQSLFDMMEQVAALGIPMCEPVEFGTCDDNALFQGGVYSLQSWIDGEDLEVVLPLLSETEQYVLGLKSGEIIRKMHTVPAPETQEEWEIRFNKKIDRNIDLNKKCVEEGFSIDGLELLLDFVQNNRHLLKNRPQCFQHGDYHVGNMMLENGELKIIDFDRCDFGDPWEEFNRMTFNAAASPHFATGLLRGYFNGEPPQEFFKLQAFYIASTHLGGLSWARKFGESEIVFTKKRIADILSWFDNMDNPVPSWYLKDFYIQWTDGVPYKLKAPFDFTFLEKYGKVFKVFDDQDGGNVCFGVEKYGKRYFIKFAGAPQARYNGKIEDAIDRLKASVQVYQNIGEHPNLIRFIEAEEIGGGFAVIFEWTDAQGIARMYPIIHKRFMALPIEKRIKVFEDILSFHNYVCKQGYVAIDFYDGSIMYDFQNEKTMICDIDFYQKMPYRGEMGLWGSSRFVSPEECRQGEIMDEVTTVYTMGQTAFCLFTDSDRSPEAWPLNM
ncbi:MAG: phosphotransferase, partial [Lachnoclostridium sp.]|nr:phosphotransferase [Lachnoclostridium sp.]